MIAGLLAAAALVACGTNDKTGVPADPDRGKPLPAPPTSTDAPAIDAALGAAIDAATSGATMSLEIKLTTTTTTLAMADRAKFRIGFEVVNTGSEPVDPAMGGNRCTLTVNGQTSHPWMLAINNGARDAKWKSLRPGQTLAMSWPLGESLFPGPGAYHLVMTAHGRDFAADVVVK